PLHDALPIFLGVTVGYLLARYRFPGQPALRAASLAGYLLAPVVLVLPYFRLLSGLGLVDTLAGVIVAHVSFCLPLAVLIGAVAVRSVPVALEEVALIDGCSTWRRLIGVV